MFKYLASVCRELRYVVTSYNYRGYYYVNAFNAKSLSLVPMLSPAECTVCVISKFGHCAELHCMVIKLVMLCFFLLPTVLQRLFSLCSNER